MFSSTDGSSLFTVRHIKDMCRMEKSIRKYDTFTKTCVKPTSRETCCQSWSLGNYILLLTNKTDCQDITSRDVRKVLDLLKKCVGYYHNFTLEPNCSSFEGESAEYFRVSDQREKCEMVPNQCKQHNAVYQILHYLTDVKFLGKDDIKKKPFLEYSMVFLPIAGSIASTELYKDVVGGNSVEGKTEVVAMNFGIKHSLFDFHLVADTAWLGVAICLVFVVMWIYTASLFITLMTAVSIFLSLEIAYFLYTMVFEIKFFPFMNLLAVVILIGIGADDVFLYCRIWNLAKSEKNNGTLEKIVSDTLKHATLSMFCTSLTTAAALYASYVSNITAIRCFAIYAGTTILTNFFVVITWVPATIVVHEKWVSNWCICYTPDIYTPKRGFFYYMCKVPYQAYYCFSDWSRIFFEKLLPCVIVKLRVLWIILYGGLGIGGLVVIFYYPKIQLPSSNEFQVFSADHPLEVYDLKIRDLFWFEKAAGGSIPTMPMTIVWGVRAVDNGYHLNPHSRGTIEFDNTFNVGTERAQAWLYGFCQRLRGTKFYQLSSGTQLTNCFIEHFKKFMERGCLAPDGKDYSPCCRTSKFPYKEEVFSKCLRIWMPIFTQSRLLYPHNKFAGPRYSLDSGRIVALIVEFNSKVPFSFNYKKMSYFYENMNKWVTQEMTTAPPEMRKGWFTSELEFYDLQDCLSRGTPIAIAVSVAVAALVVFFTTLNILISLYAIFSIAAIIFVTVAALVLLGWELNILESVTVSIAVGLSIDLTLHYGVAYRLSPDLDREMRVVCSIARMGSPVAMAAMTTFLAGAMMMPSTVLAYRQLGTFLMLIMAVSWLYSTFFFQSMLRILGPQGGFGQFHWPSLDCCAGSNREHVDKTIYSMSESTLSSSSTTNHANSSETHELEPLTDRNESHNKNRQKVAARYMNSISESPRRNIVVTIHPPSPMPSRKSNPYSSVNSKIMVENDKENHNKDNGQEIWVPRSRSNFV